MQESQNHSPNDIKGGHWEGFWMQYWSSNLEVAKTGANMIISSSSSILVWYRQILWQHQIFYLPQSLGKTDLLTPLYQVQTYLPWPILLHNPICTHDRHNSDNFSKYISKCFLENGLALKTCLLSLKHITPSVMVYVLLIQ